jgi:RecA/RadA recombinase
MTDDIEKAAKAMSTTPPVDAEAPVTRWLSTGSTQLDLAISDHYPGGVGEGRISHFWGGSSTAKSVIAQEILGSAQRLGGHGVFEDTEGTLDLGRAKLFGMHVGKWLDPQVMADGLDVEDMAKACATDPRFTYRHPATIEELYDRDIAGLVGLLTKCNIKSPVAIGIDSVTALTNAAALGEELGKPSFGTARAKIFGEAFRKYLFPMASLGITMVAIDQSRDNISGYGPAEVYSGGNAITFYASTRVFLKMTAKLTNSYDQVIGIKCEFDVQKNKLAPPHRKGWFNLLFDVGIDDVTSNIEWLREHAELSPEELQAKEELVMQFQAKMASAPKASQKREIKKELEAALKKLDKKSGWWEFGGKKFQNKDDLVRYIEEQDLVVEVEKETARVWRIVHAPTGRRPRHPEME